MQNAQDDDEEEDEGGARVVPPSPSPPTSAPLSRASVTVGSGSPPRHLPRAQDTMPSFPLVDYDDDDEDEVRLQHLWV